jgi:hypothetical protein
LQRYQDGAKVVSIAIFSSLVLLVMVYYLRRDIEVDEEQWDMATVTAADYTVDF